jgi:hypothetical protein
VQQGIGIKKIQLFENNIIPALKEKLPAHITGL